MEESTNNSEGPVADPPAAQRREEVTNLGIKLRQEERALNEWLQRLDSAEAVAKLVVPQHFRGHSDGWLAAQRTTANAPDSDPYVQAFVDDLNTYAALTGMRAAIQSLMSNNRRFAMVLDLILAAMPLVKMNTHRMAKQCCETHVHQCHAVGQQLHVLLSDFPRSHGLWARAFGRPSA